jgi:hypothetical protein
LTSPLIPFSFKHLLLDVARSHPLQTGTLEDHIEAVRDVLHVAELHDLYFKPSKCTFHASSIDYLGVIIEKGMIHVTDLPEPPSARTAKEKLKDLKQRARRYARDQGSCDDVQISYLETLEDHNNDNLRLVQMLAR